MARDRFIDDEPRERRGSSVADGVKMGCGAFIVLPLLIGAVVVLLMLLMVMCA